MLNKGVFKMARDPQSRDWKIDKFMSKYIAAFPERKPLTYEEVGEIIDNWDRMERHITYPMAAG